MNPWHYFLGKEGNAHGYPRHLSQWFDGKRWKRCFASTTVPPFQPEQKYRKPL